MKTRPVLFQTEMVRAILNDRKSITRRVIKPQPYILIGTQPDEWLAKYPELCPYGKAGDRLWVRECFAVEGSNIWYRADGTDHNGNVEYPDGFTHIPKWKPSIHMPRKYSRLTLEITKVRVERVQEITEEDALKEGISEFFKRGLATAQFGYLWDKMHGKKYPWASNPWVWCVSFKVEK